MEHVGYSATLCVSLQHVFPPVYLPWILLQVPEALAEAFFIHWSLALLNALTIPPMSRLLRRTKQDVLCVIVIASALTKQFQYENLMFLMIYFPRPWMLLDILGQEHHLTSKGSFPSSHILDGYQKRSYSSNVQTLVLIQTGIAKCKRL